MRIRYSGLPAGYKRVKYLESTGTQYIDTGFTPDQDTRVDIKLSITEYNAPTNTAIFSARDTYSNRNYGMICGGDTTMFPGYGTQNSSTGITASLNALHTIIKDKNKTYYDGTLIYTNTYTTFTAPYTLWIFGCHQTSGEAFLSKLKLYSCKIYNNGTVIHNFIPCIRISDSKPGMYDTINSIFYTNSGTGEFLYGPYDDSYQLPLSSRLPSAYQQVEYIQSSGTQYISTVSAANKLFVLDMQFTSNASRQLMGLSPSSSAYWGNNQGTWEKIGTTGVSKTTLDRVKVYYDIGNITSQATNTWLEGATNKFEGTDPNWASVSVNTFVISRLDHVGGWNSSMKIFGLKVFNANNALLNNFIPCYRKSDSVIGLYDVVGQNFYTNSGSGTFAKGNDVGNIGFAHPSYVYTEGTTNLGGTSINYSVWNDGETFINPGSWGGTTGTVTIHYSGGWNDNPYKVYHRTACGTGGFYVKTANDIHIEAGKTYTVSCYMKCSKNVNSFAAHSFNINRGRDNKYITYGNSFNLTTEWKRLSFTFTASSSDAGDYGEMSIIYGSTSTTDNIDVYYSGFQVEEKDHPTLFTLSTRPDNTII